MKPTPLPRYTPFIAALALIAGTASHAFAQDVGEAVFGGAAWTQYNLIGSSSQGDKGYDGKSVLSTGVQLSLSDVLSDRLQVKAGIGVFTGDALTQAHAGYSSNSYSLPVVSPYVYDADFTYDIRKTERSDLWLRGGIFPYTYNPDSKNLGQYLLRGPVHPGIVVSGYETQGIMPVADMADLPAAGITGFQLHHRWGNFEEDFLLSTETQYFPFFDLSPAYVAQYQVHPTLRIGAGVNFYHLVPADPKLSAQYHYEYADYSDTAGGNPPKRSSIYFDGTKLMATAAFDPKPLMAPGLPFGPEDLRLYGEVALMGLEDGPGYKKLYGDYLHRMPMMAGFNLPAFNYLDHLSLEVEWYGAPFADDASNFNKGSYSTLPVASAGNVKRDNWKWSLHGSKTVQQHVQITVQVADDHYRPGIYRGYTDGELPLRQALLVTPKDWYVSTKLAYFF